MGICCARTSTGLYAARGHPKDSRCHGSARTWSRGALRPRIRLLTGSVPRLSRDAVLRHGSGSGAILGACRVPANARGCRVPFGLRRSVPKTGHESLIILCAARSGYLARTREDGSE